MKRSSRVFMRHFDGVCFCFVQLLKYNGKVSFYQRDIPRHRRFFGAENGATGKIGRKKQKINPRYAHMERQYTDASRHERALPFCNDGLHYRT